LIYQTEGGQTKIEVRLDGETLWLSQRLLAELFQVSVKTVNEHLKIFMMKANLIRGQLSGNSG